MIPELIESAEFVTANRQIRTEGTVVADTSSGNITLTLPLASLLRGRRILVKKAADANTLTVARSGSDLVAGAASFAMPGRGHFWLLSNGTGWLVVSGSYVASGIRMEWNPSTQTWVSALDGSGAASAAAMGNLLTPNQSWMSAGDATGWEVVGETQTLVASTAQTFFGTHSLLLTQSGTAALQARTTPATSIREGATYTASVRARLSVGTRSAYVRIFWFQANGTTTVGSATAGSLTALSAGDWTELTVTGVAPAGAATARVNITSATGSANDAMFFDRIGVWHGAGGLWSPPGTPIANLGTYTDESVGRRIFTWDTVNSRWQMTYGDTGWRSVSLSTAGATKFPSGEVWIRRVNNLVRARFYAGTGTVTGAGITIVASLPTGFRPTSLNTRGAIGSAIMANSGLPAPHGYYCTDQNLIVACTSNSPDTLHGEVSSETSDAWPTSLPGTAVGSIPS